MFSRGTRFPAAKATEVPGPGAYDPHDPEYDAYKRGAFLEKTNRFDKEKDSEVPGPGAYETEATNGQNRPPTRTSNTTPTDRLAILQRKLEELERIHIEDKKAHHLEQERLKLELGRAQRTTTEQSERAEKLKKQNDALDARVQELKKASATEQAELRELRVKLRASEHERAQLAAKQGDAAEARKAEAKRRDELRMQDRKIADLEKALSVEKKKREGVEAKLNEAKTKTDERVREACVAAEEAQSRVKVAEKEAQVARDALQQLEHRAEDSEEELLAQLEQHRYALSRVAEEYGRLASNTVPLPLHSRVKFEVEALHLRNHRLEWKLNVSRAQIDQLADLIRQSQEENFVLHSQLESAQSEAKTNRKAVHELLQAARTVPDGLFAVATVLADMVQDQCIAERDTHNAVQSDLRLWTSLDRAQKESLLYHTSVLLKEIDKVHAHVGQYTKQLSEAEGVQAQLTESLQRAKAEHEEAQRMLAESAALLAESNARAEAYKKQVDRAQTEARAEVAQAQQSLEQEKQATKRLAASLHQTKQAEQFLRSEVEQLSSDLAEAEKFQEAYSNLLAEVDGLVVKNALAEDEAQRLSRFNAEILGHNNPAQRIMYVDRIRRELHETKHKLLLSTRDRDTVLADNDDLRAELDMYKSVAFPPEAKPRTTITRITRTHGGSDDVGSARIQDHAQGLQRPMFGSKLMSVSECSTLEDDMTVDEIM